MAIEYNAGLLRTALQYAFFNKTAAQKEHLPQGVFRVEPFEPKSLADRLHRLFYEVAYGVRGEVIVTMDGAPTTEHYKTAVDTINERIMGSVGAGKDSRKVPKLTLHNMANTPAEGSQGQGSVDSLIFLGDVRFARISYSPQNDPQTPIQHRVAIYSPKDVPGFHTPESIDLGALLLANYLNLRQK